MIGILMRVENHCWSLRAQIIRANSPDCVGCPGLAAAGSVVIGPTLALIAALLFDVDLRRFAI